MTTEPFPTHEARALPPPTNGVHSIEFLGDEIFMIGWDGEAPQLINLDTNLDFSEHTSG